MHNTKLGLGNSELTWDKRLGAQTVLSCPTDMIKNFDKAGKLSVPQQSCNKRLERATAVTAEGQCAREIKSSVY